MAFYDLSNTANNGGVAVSDDQSENAQSQPTFYDFSGEKVVNLEDDDQLFSTYGVDYGTNRFELRPLMRQMEQDGVPLDRQMKVQQRWLQNTKDFYNSQPDSEEKTNALAEIQRYEDNEMYKDNGLGTWTQNTARGIDAGITNANARYLEKLRTFFADATEEEIATAKEMALKQGLNLDGIFDLENEARRIANEMVKAKADAYAQRKAQATTPEERNQIEQEMTNDPELDPNNVLNKAETELSKRLGQFESTYLDPLVTKRVMDNYNMDARNLEQFSRDELLDKGVPKKELDKFRATPEQLHRLGLPPDTELYLLSKRQHADILNAHYDNGVARTVVGEGKNKETLAQAREKRAKGLISNQSWLGAGLDYVTQGAYSTANTYGELIATTAITALTGGLGGLGAAGTQILGNTLINFGVDEQDVKLEKIREYAEAKGWDPRYLSLEQLDQLETEGLLSGDLQKAYEIQKQATLGRVLAELGTGGGLHVATKFLDKLGPRNTKLKFVKEAISFFLKATSEAPEEVAGEIAYKVIEHTEKHPDKPLNWKEISDEIGIRNTALSAIFTGENVAKQAGYAYDKYKERKNNAQPNAQPAQPTQPNAQPAQPTQPNAQPAQPTQPNAQPEQTDLEPPADVPQEYLDMSMDELEDQIDLARTFENNEAELNRMERALQYKKDVLDQQSQQTPNPSDTPLSQDNIPDWLRENSSEFNFEQVDPQQEQSDTTDKQDVLTEIDDPFKRKSAQDEAKENKEKELKPEDTVIDEEKLSGIDFSTYNPNSVQDNKNLTRSEVESLSDEDIKAVVKTMGNMTLSDDAVYFREEFEKRGLEQDERRETDRSSTQDVDGQTDGATTQQSDTGGEKRSSETSEQVSPTQTETTTTGHSQSDTTSTANTTEQPDNNTQNSSETGTSGRTGETDGQRVEQGKSRESGSQQDRDTTETTQQTSSSSGVQQRPQSNSEREALIAEKQRLVEENDAIRRKTAKNDPVKQKRIREIVRQLNDGMDPSQRLSEKERRQYPPDMTDEDIIAQKQRMQDFRDKAKTEQSKVEQPETEKIKPPKRTKLTVEGLTEKLKTSDDLKNVSVQDVKDLGGSSKLNGLLSVVDTALKNGVPYDDAVEHTKQLAKELGLSEKALPQALSRANNLDNTYPYKHLRDYKVNNTLGRLSEPTTRSETEQPKTEQQKPETTNVVSAHPVYKEYTATGKVGTKRGVTVSKLKEQSSQMWNDFKDTEHADEVADFLQKLAEANRSNTKSKNLYFDRDDGFIRSPAKKTAKDLNAMAKKEKTTSTPKKPTLEERQAKLKTEQEENAKVASERSQESNEVEAQAEYDRIVSQENAQRLFKEDVDLNHVVNSAYKNTDPANFNVKFTDRQWQGIKAFYRTSLISKRMTAFFHRQNNPESKSHELRTNVDKTGLSPQQKAEILIERLGLDADFAQPFTAQETVTATLANNVQEVTPEVAEQTVNAVMDDFANESEDHANVVDQLKSLTEGDLFGTTIADVIQDQTTSDNFINNQKNKKLRDLAKKLLDKIRAVALAVIAVVSIGAMTVPQDAVAKDNIITYSQTQKVDGVSKQASDTINAVVQNKDHNGRNFVVADKSTGQFMIVSPDGKVLHKQNALFGKDKDSGARFTPTGRFYLAKVGKEGLNATDLRVFGDSVLDLMDPETNRPIANKDGIIAVHRVINKAERHKALKSATAKDNFMSYGCINIPTAFYNQNVDGLDGAMVYVLPENANAKQGKLGLGEVVTKQGSMSTKAVSSTYTKSSVKAPDLSAPKAPDLSAPKAPRFSVFSKNTPDLTKAFRPVEKADLIKSELDLDQAEHTLKSKLGNLAKKVTLVTQADFDNLDKSSFKDFYKAGVEGLYDPKTQQVYIVADNIQSQGKFTAEERLTWVALHELGHAGLHHQYGKQLDTVLNDLNDNEVIHSLAESIQIERGENGVLIDANEALEEAMAELYAAVMSNDVDALQERYKVVIPQDLRNINTNSRLNRYMAKFRNFIRKVFNKKVLANKDVVDLLLGLPVDKLDDADPQAKQFLADLNRDLNDPNSYLSGAVMFSLSNSFSYAKRGLRNIFNSSDIANDSEGKTAEYANAQHPNAVIRTEKGKGVANKIVEAVVDSQYTAVRALGGEQSYASDVVGRFKDYVGKERAYHQQFSQKLTNLQDLSRKYLNNYEKAHKKKFGKDPYRSNADRLSVYEKLQEVATSLSVITGRGREVLDLNDALSTGDKKHQGLQKQLNNALQARANVLNRLAQGKSSGSLAKIDARIKELQEMLMAVEFKAVISRRFNNTVTSNDNWAVEFDAQAQHFTQIAEDRLKEILNLIPNSVSVPRNIIAQKRKALVDARIAVPVDFDAVKQARLDYARAMAEVIDDQVIANVQMRDPKLANELISRATKLASFASLAEELTKPVIKETYFSYEGGKNFADSITMLLRQQEVGTINVFVQGVPLKQWAENNGFVEGEGFPDKKKDYTIDPTDITFTDGLQNNGFVYNKDGVIIDGVQYEVRNDGLYDTQGNRVKDKKRDFSGDFGSLLMNYIGLSKELDNDIRSELQLNAMTDNPFAVSQLGETKNIKSLDNYGVHGEHNASLMNEQISKTDVGSSRKNLNGLSYGRSTGGMNAYQALVTKAQHVASTKAHMDMGKKFVEDWMGASSISTEHTLPYTVIQQDNAFFGQKDGITVPFYLPGQQKVVYFRVTFNDQALSDSYFRKNIQPSYIQDFIKMKVGANPVGKALLWSLNTIHTSSRWVAKGITSPILWAIKNAKQGFTEMKGQIMSFAYNDPFIQSLKPEYRKFWDKGGNTAAIDALMTGKALALATDKKAMTEAATLFAWRMSNRRNVTSERYEKLLAKANNGSASAKKVLAYYDRLVELKDNGQLTVKADMATRDLNFADEKLNQWGITRVGERVDNFLTFSATTPEYVSRLMMDKVLMSMMDDSALLDPSLTTQQVEQIRKEMRDKVGRTMRRTMNFNDIGSSGLIATLRHFMPFVNATAQGSKGLINTLKTRNGQKLLATKLAYGVALRIMMASLTELFPCEQGADGKTLNLFRNEYSTMREVPIQIGCDYEWRLPVAYGLNMVAWGIANAIYDYAVGRKTGGEAVTHVWHALLENLSPLPVATQDGILPMIVSYTAPLATKKFINVQTGTDDFGNRLNHPLADNKDAPERWRFKKDKTPLLFQDIAEFMHDITFGKVNFTAEEIGELMSIVTEGTPKELLVGVSNAVYAQTGRIDKSVGQAITEGVARSAGLQSVLRDKKPEEVIRQQYYTIKEQYKDVYDKMYMAHKKQYGTPTLFLSKDKSNIMSWAKKNFEDPKERQLAIYFAKHEQEMNQIRRSKDSKETKSEKMNKAFYNFYFNASQLLLEIKE